MTLLHIIWPILHFLDMMRQITAFDIVQASAGVGYASVKLMQYDVSHFGDSGKAMDIAEMVKCA